MKYLLSIILFFGLCNFTQAQQDRIVLRSERCSTSYSEDISVEELFYRNRKYGYVIWLNPTKVKVNTITSKGSYRNTYERFDQWADSEEVILSSSAGYANRNFASSVGLCIDEGQVINRQIQRDMDALVIVQNGQVNIHNLERSIYLKGTSTKFYLRDVSDFNRFTTWAKKKKTSAFQTNLLAYDGEMKITSSGKLRRALRKFLVIVSKNNIEKNMIVYVQRPDYLYDSTKKIFNYLQTNDWHIHAIANLDTGANDILELSDTYKNCNSKTIMGRTTINYATNLLVFYK